MDDVEELLENLSVAWELYRAAPEYTAAEDQALAYLNSAANAVQLAKQGITWRPRPPHRGHPSQQGRPS
jgi:hypothetical protein